MSTSLSDSHGLSLQERLDRISRDRAVLDLRRDLARLGFHEGDLVLNREDGAIGRLLVDCSDAMPFAAVAFDDGTRVRFATEEWQRAPA
jgi:hypothetical protein